MNEKGLKEIEKQLKIALKKSNTDFSNILIKRSCVILALQHKEQCNDKFCKVVLYHLVMLLSAAKINLTEEERMVFL